MMKWRGGVKNRQSNFLAGTGRHQLVHELLMQIDPFVQDAMDLASSSGLKIYL